MNNPGDSWLLVTIPFFQRFFFPWLTEKPFSFKRVFVGAGTRDQSAYFPMAFKGAFHAKKRNDVAAREPFHVHSGIARYQRSGIGKSVVMIMVLAVLIFVAASAIISQSSINEMTNILCNQFNEEQMAIAHMDLGSGQDNILQ